MTDQNIETMSNGDASVPTRTTDEAVAAARGGIESNEWASWLWDHTGEAKLFLDRDRRIRFCNQALARQLRRTRGWIEGRSIGSLLDDDDAEHMAADFDDLLSGRLTNVGPVVVGLVERTGHVVPMAFSAERFTDGVLLYGRALPVAVTDIYNLPDSVVNQIIEAHIGRWLRANVKTVAFTLMGVAGIVRMDDVLRMLGGILGGGQ